MVMNANNYTDLEAYLREIDSCDITDLEQLIKINVKNKEK